MPADNEAVDQAPDELVHAEAVGRSGACCERPKEILPGLDNDGLLGRLEIHLKGKESQDRRVTGAQCWAGWAEQLEVSPPAKARASDLASLPIVVELGEHTSMLARK